MACAAPTAKLEVAGADADRREKSPEPRATEPALNSTLSRLRRTKPRVSRFQSRLRRISAGKIGISSDALTRVLRRHSNSDRRRAGRKTRRNDEPQHEAGRTGPAGSCRPASRRYYRRVQLRPDPAEQLAGHPGAFLTREPAPGAGTANLLCTAQSTWLTRSQLMQIAGSARSRRPRPLLSVTGDWHHLKADLR